MELNKAITHLNCSAVGEHGSDNEYRVTPVSRITEGSRLGKICRVGHEKKSDSRRKSRMGIAKLARLRRRRHHVYSSRW